MAAYAAMPCAPAELRREERQQRHLRFFCVPDVQLVGSCEEGDLSGGERHRARGELQLASARDHIQHQVGPAVAVRWKCLSRRQADDAHVCLIAFDQGFGEELAVGGVLDVVDARELHRAKPTQPLTFTSVSMPPGSTP
jgi:hypothetical protein